MLAKASLLVTPVHVAILGVLPKLSLSFILLPQVYVTVLSVVTREKRSSTEKSLAKGTKTAAALRLLAARDSWKVDVVTAKPATSVLGFGARASYCQALLLRPRSSDLPRYKAGVQRGRAGHEIRPPATW